MLSNRCARLPCEYRIEATGSAVVTANQQGTLEGADVDADRSRQTITVEYTVPQYGLSRDVIVVHNRSTPSQSLVLPIALFVDDASLHVVPTRPPPPRCVRPLASRRPF